MGFLFKIQCMLVSRFNEGTSAVTVLPLGRAAWDWTKAHHFGGVLVWLHFHVLSFPIYKMEMIIIPDLVRINDLPQVEHFG